VWARAAWQVTITNAAGSFMVDNSPSECIRHGLQANGLESSTDLAANLASLPTPMFPTTTPMVHMYEAVRQASEAGYYFMGILNTPLAGWFVASLILLAYFVERMQVRVLDEYLEQKFSELDSQRLQMEKQIEMRERRIQMQIQMRHNA